MRAFDFGCIEKTQTVILMEIRQLIQKLKSMANEKNVDGMVRFGINPKNTLGISVYDLRAIGKEIGKGHDLALKLWESGIHEARILAAFVEDYNQVTEFQMERWVNDFDSWDICDQVCNSVFAKTPFAHKKALEWASRKSEFVKRAGFVLMACLVLHNKNAEDKQFLGYMPIIRRESKDERNFVKKAVNWALRQIGKKNKILNITAIRTAKEIEQVDSKCAKWIAKDALRELESGAVQNRLKGKK
ncbi:MAG: DNA alkylation repair protein [Candidatus Micrarchaeota archaeon]